MCQKHSLSVFLTHFFFQEFHAGGIVSVAAAHPYVLQFQAALRSWALDPELALQFEGKGMAIVQTHPLLPILLRRLHIVFRVMSLKPVRTPVAIFGSLGVCIYGPASRHWLISYSPIHLT